MKSLRGIVAALVLVVLSACTVSSPQDPMSSAMNSFLDRNREAAELLTSVGVEVLEVRDISIVLAEESDLVLAAETLAGPSAISELKAGRFQLNLVGVERDQLDILPALLREDELRKFEFSLRVVNFETSLDRCLPLVELSSSWTDDFFITCGPEDDITGSLGLTGSAAQLRAWIPRLREAFDHGLVSLSFRRISEQDADTRFTLRLAPGSQHGWQEVALAVRSLGWEGELTITVEPLGEFRSTATGTALEPMPGDDPHHLFPALIDAWNATSS